MSSLLGKRVIVIQRGTDRIWNTFRGRVKSDGGRDNVEVDGKTYLIPSDQDVIDYVPTKMNKLGLSRGLYPCIVVAQNDPNPVRVRENGVGANTSSNLTAFKRMTLTQKLVDAASKDEKGETMKWMVIGALGLLSIILVMLAYIMNSLGLLGGDAGLLQGGK